MKKVFFLFAFFGLLAFTANAQTHKGCAGKATTSSEKATCYSTAATKAASLDQTVEQRLDAKTGQVTFVRKSVCATSGKVSYAQVEFCNKSKKFVNVSPAAAKTVAAEKPQCSAKASATAVSATGEKASCASKASDKAGCCASKAKATSTSTAAAGCCSGKADKASCAAKASKASKTSETKVKLVKQEQN
jgi:hypothetical protein